MTDFDQLIDRTNTNSYKWDKYPPSVIPLWVADMDFEVAKPIKTALEKIVEHGVIGYSSTPDELLEVIIERLRSLHNWQIKKEWIILLPGLIPGLSTSAKCISKEPYAIMTSTPVYRPFLESAEYSDNELQNIPFVWENNRWEMDFDLMQSVVNERTKMFMLCNPHNPNGRVFTESELKRLADFCVKNNIVLCSDEIHCDLILDATKKHISVATLSPEIEQLSITLLAPSKTFNIAGLGCSMAIIPNKELRDKFERTRYGMMPMLSSFAMESALAAYKYCENWRIEMIDYLKSNHDYLLTEINKIEGLSMQPLEATYLAWINYTETGNENLVKDLELNGIGVQDATIFGGKGYFRLNFATQKSRLVEAILRIKNTLGQK
jgi:cysteine-S-conjugate beta-lyase